MSPASQNSSFPKKEGIVLILSGPSGTGKTTLCQKLMKNLPELSFSISHTTRSPRENEIDGKDYHFISEKEFHAMRERGDFLEWANYNNNYYGTAFESIMKSRANGQDILLELDTQGAETLRKLKYPGIFIFLLPPSLEDLKFRLNFRATESKEIIKQRLEAAIREIKVSLAYDYILISHEVEKSVINIAAIFRAEKLKASRFISPSKDIQELLETK